MSQLYVGLMSGTSLDGVDAVLVEIKRAAAGAGTLNSQQILHAVAQPYPEALKAAVLVLCRDKAARLVELGRIDVELARWYAAAVKQLLHDAKVEPGAVRAIGSHGQTVHHEPLGTAPFTMQLGDPNMLAVQTGITVVADFRRRDMALGGQGAPLAPGFHDAVFRHPTRCRVVLNCGGIANISVLAPGQDCIGYDTGPANILMDAWVHARTGQPYDKDGAWALKGQVHQPLLQHMRSDPYFALPTPKSTGREHFNLAWVQRHVQAIGANATPSDVDVQRTLLELTASTVADAIASQASGGDLLVAGGGAYNRALFDRLRALCANWTVDTTTSQGIPPEHVEATAFAVFAQRTLDGLTGNLPSVTGASRACVLGGIYPP